MLGCVDYIGVWDVPSAHPGLYKHGYNAPQIYVDQFDYGNDLTGNGHRQMLPF